MSSLLPRSAAGALRRSIRYRPCVPRLVVENPRLFSSGFARRTHPTKEQDQNFHILKHMKILEEKELRAGLARAREENKYWLEKHSRLQKELELKRCTEKYENLKKIMMWTAGSFLFFFALDKIRDA